MQPGAQRPSMSRILRAPTRHKVQQSKPPKARQVALLPRALEGLALARFISHYTLNNLPLCATDFIVI